MVDCVFCKIARKEIPAEFIAEDDNFVAFKDINPKAPVHLLIIPKEHFGPVSSLAAGDSGILGKMIIKAKEVAEGMKVSSNGYRLIFNVGKDAGMEVSHLHLHLLAGKLLKFEF